MPRRILKLVTGRVSRPSRPTVPSHVFTAEDLVWVMGSFCALNRKPFDPELVVRQFPPPYGADSLVHAARVLDFRIKRKETAAESISALNLPCLVVLHEDGSSAEAAESEPTPLRPKSRPAIVIQATKRVRDICHLN